jgi:capsular polysaccharide biosynthesis protein
MELRRYWHIVRRRLGLILLLLLVVLVSYVALTETPPTLYTTSMRFVVGVRPEAGAHDQYRYDRYYTWVTAEYLVDDLSEVVKSRAFAQDIAERAGLAVPAGAIQGATAAGKLHRILTVTVTWPDAAELERLANAIVITLRDEGGAYFAQLSTEDAVISLIDPPVIGVVGPSLRQRLDLPLRLILALMAGVGLAFLFDYLDDTIREEDLAMLGLDTLARIPTERRALRAWRRHNPTS